jgi:uncharacterized damage-inducible protein DinB
MDQKLIEEYEKGGDDLRMAVRGLDREDLVAYPVPGTWSIQQIVIHLLDSEIAFVDRMKRVIADDNPPLLAYDENKFAKNLLYDEQSPEDAITIVELNRRNFARVLKKLPESAFDRVGVHSERGTQKLSEILGYAVNHLKHHLKFIVDKREKMGKLMW